MEATPQPHHPLKRVIESKAPQECITTVSSPKPNQVGTVLLYGIPIVSLFIESQERLCLAQISNTLLKQYSYNEIHNRRVALGITCVQCTPVQLEILRRAGAMPVSSRRCGMITRREAERLCKSFLGDNTPPRLPEDFAFSVHHECAWGCRGSFLPARYNSSRAKCIKCAYCALFFSPNKFIFHSHRIGPGDKYVQPDAANFNSWRRHMKLSGNPHEKIVHAWEDVKAMFNGGTRKRLIMSATSGGSDSHGGRASNRVGSPKRLKESSPIGRHDISPPLIHAAAAVTVVSAAPSTGTANMPPIRPVQLLPNGTTVSSGNNVSSLTSSATSMSPSSGTISAGTAPSRIPALCSELHFPFTRGLMMDYMWHSQTKASAFQFSNYLQPWIKRPGALFLNDQHQNSQHLANGVSIAPTIPLVAATDETYTAGDATGALSSSSQPPLSPSFPPKASLSAYNNSAFRPVVNHHQHSRVGAGAPAMTSTVHLLDDDQQTSSSRNSRDDGTNGSATIKESLSSDEEMVDIETTEDDDNPRAHNNPHHTSNKTSNDQHHQSRNSGMHYKHIDELISVKVSKPSPSIVNSDPSNKINCWNDTAADYLKKRLTCRNLSSFQSTTTPSPSLEPAHSSPASISSCGASSDESSPDVFPLPSREHPNMLHISSTPAVIADPINTVSSAGSNVAATAAAAAVAIAAFSHISCQPSPPAKSTVANSTYEGSLPTIPSLPQSLDQSDKGLTNNLYGNLIINNNNNNNRNMNNNSFNNGSNVSQNISQQTKTGLANNNRNSPLAGSEQLCSVARLSFDRMDYNSLTPFYRHDITKHFHSFRHQNEQPQTNGGIG